MPLFRRCHVSQILSLSFTLSLFCTAVADASPVRRGPTAPDAFLKRLFEVASEVPSKRAKRALKAVLSDPETFHFQLIVTELDPETQALTPHEYRVDQDYIYPASAIKTFASLASLMYLRKLSKAEETAWVSPDSPISFHPTRCERKDKHNLSSGLMTLAHEIKQTQLVSSNRAFNHVFDVVGSERLHEDLLPLFPSLRLYHRLSTNETHEETLTVPPLSICEARPPRKRPSLDRKERRRRATLRATATRLSDRNAPTHGEPPFTGYGVSRESLKIGQAYLDAKTNALVKAPMDFSWKNRVSFYDFQRLMFAIYQPELRHDAFDLPIQLTRGPEVPAMWLNMLRSSMVTYPHDSKNPKYQGKSLSETRFKPLIRGVRMSSAHVSADGEGTGLVSDQNLYYMNKAGKALGFHLDNALIGIGPGQLKLTSDHRPVLLKRALYITVGLYINQDQVLNDNKYEYSQISVPLFDALGYAVGRYLQGEL